MDNLTFSKAKLLMDSCPYSQFQSLVKNRHIVLAPKFLGNIAQGIKEQLNSELQLVANWADGVLIAYNNVKILNPVGRIFEDSPYIHLSIQADFIIFHPTIGCQLKGVVNKKSPRHVGCLVHGCFNGSVHKPHGQNNWVGSDLDLGEEFTFTVTHIYMENNVISLRGNIVEDSLISKKKTNSRKTVFEDLDKGDNSDSNGDSGIGDIILHKPSKRKDKITEELDTSKDKLKSKKKKKHKQQGEDESFCVASSDNGMTELELSSKKKKKHKNKDEATEKTLSVDTSESFQETKKSKKKKKHKIDHDDSCENEETIIKSEGDGNDLETSTFSVDSSLNDSVSKKKKKKKKKLENEEELNLSDTRLINESTVSKSAQKRKHKSVNESIDHSPPHKKSRKSI